MKRETGRRERKVYGEDEAIEEYLGNFEYLSLYKLLCGRSTEIPAPWISYIAVDQWMVKRVVEMDKGGLIGITLYGVSSGEIYGMALYEPKE